MGMIETKGEGVREAWRGAWGVVLRWAPVIVGAQAGFFGLCFCLVYLRESLPEWVYVVMMFVLVFPLMVLMVIVFFIFPFTIETRVFALVEEIKERRRIGGGDVFEGVKTFGGLSSVFFVFVPALVFVVVEVIF